MSRFGYCHHYDDKCGAFGCYKCDSENYGSKPDTKFVFEAKNPAAKNCQVVRALNAILLEADDDLARTLRDRTIRLQGTPFADTGLPFTEAVRFLETRKALGGKNETTF